MALSQYLVIKSPSHEVLRIVPPESEQPDPMGLDRSD